MIHTKRASAATRAAVAGILSVSLLGYGGTAFADPGSGNLQGDADKAAAAIAAVAQGATPVTPSADGSDISVSTDLSSVQIPTAPDGTITMGPASPDAPAATLTVSLPRDVTGDRRHGKGTVARDGTVVYPSASTDGTDAAVQVLADGSVRLATVIKSRKGPLRSTYTL